METENSIFVRTQFSAFHKYEGAPGVVGFLKNLHRHLFFVEVKIEVFNCSREIEFFIIKYNLDSFLRNNFEHRIVSSCEEVANLILDFLDEKFYLYGRKIEVVVSEDNENGAKVNRIGKKIKDYSINYGIEQEGRYRGLETIFINGDCSYEKIVDCIKKNKEIHQVYFGANHQSFVIDFDVIKRIVKDYPNLLVSFEIDFHLINLIDPEILKDEKIHKIITLKNLDVNNLMIKVENSKGVYCYDDFIFNDFSVYSEDKILE